MLLLSSAGLFFFKINIFNKKGRVGGVAWGGVGWGGVGWRGWNGMGKSGMGWVDR